MLGLMLGASPQAVGRSYMVVGCHRPRTIFCLFVRHFTLFFGLLALFGSPRGTPGRCPSDPSCSVRLPGTAGSDSQPFQVITRSEKTKRSQKSTKTSIFTQIGVTWSLVTQARGPETKIGRKIHKLECQEQILRTIWLSSSYGSEKNLT